MSCFVETLEIKKSVYIITSSRGGEYVHTLSVNEMPSHSHAFALEGGTITKPASYVAGVTGSLGTGSSKTTTSVGGSQSHNNVQPYTAVYMYKRTA